MSQSVVIIDPSGELSLAIIQQYLLRAGLPHVNFVGEELHVGHAAGGYLAFRRLVLTAEAIEERKLDVDLPQPFCEQLSVSSSIILIIYNDQELAALAVGIIFDDQTVQSSLWLDNDNGYLFSYDELRNRLKNGMLDWR